MEDKMFALECIKNKNVSLDIRIVCQNQANFTNAASFFWVL